MSAIEEEKSRMLSVELLDKISKKAQSQKLFIELDRLEPNAIHKLVLNSLTEIFKMIKDEMSEQDFSIALGTYSNKIPEKVSEFELTK